MKERILLVEDDAGLLAVTKTILSDQGYGVTAAGSVEEALQVVKSRPPDLIISDINLPGISGLRFCRMLKSDHRTMSLPLILLTQLGSEGDKVRGLQTGADDYLTKPFSHRELLARVEALLRRVRRAGSTSRRLEAGGLVVDMDARRVAVDGKPLSLRRKEYELLILLMENKGRLLSKDAIVDALWKDEAIVTNNTLSVHVRNLREKLGRCRDMIETLVGEGYRFAES